LVGTIDIAQQAGSRSYLSICSAAIESAASIRSFVACSSEPRALGLDGPVSPEAYEAVFGPGGAHHPQSGERLVAARRPGMELVISAHKSVPELG
jgi:hypothetical protein